METGLAYRLNYSIAASHKRASGRVTFLEAKAADAQRNRAILIGAAVGEVVKLFAGRAMRGVRIPKPKLCAECDDPIEAARLQVQPKARHCVSCAKSAERSRSRALLGASDRDIVIIRG